MTDSPLTDSIHATAASLIALEYPQGSDRTQETSALQQDLRERVWRIQGDDISDLETMLVCQAQLLHHIFTNSTHKYATTPMPDKSHHHSNVAFKSQQYCRMTIAAINALRSKGLPTLKHKKSNNELLRREIPYAALDTRRTPAPTGADQWLAAMEKGVWR